MTSPVKHGDSNTRCGIVRRGTVLAMALSTALLSLHAYAEDNRQATTTAAPSSSAATSVIDHANSPTSPASQPSAAPSNSCTEMGLAARAVAAWRDAGGAAWMAKAKLDQQIDEPAVRQAAQQLVDTLYTGTMRKLNPDETALAVAKSCMDATTQENGSPSAAPH